VLSEVTSVKVLGFVSGVVSTVSVFHVVFLLFQLAGEALVVVTSGAGVGESSGMSFITFVL